MIKSMSRLSLSDVEGALSKVTHPEISCSLINLGMIEDVTCKSCRVHHTLNS